VRTGQSFPGKFEWQFKRLDESDVNWHAVFHACNAALITQVPELQQLAYFGQTSFTVTVVAAITIADGDEKNFEQRHRDCGRIFQFSPRAPLLRRERAD
jgi:hypothetical protein